MKKKYEYFIGYKDNDDYEIKPLHIILPITSTFVNSFDGQTKWMIFFTKDAELLEKHTDIWIKVGNCIKKELDCKPIYINFF